MKFLITLLVFIFTNFPILAQHYITGKVIDENNQPLEFVVLTALQNDSIVKETVVKEDGNFSIELQTGNYLLNVIYFGKIILNQELIVTKSVNIGVLKANIGSLKLDDFTVEGERNIVERKVDRLIFNVEKTVAADGGDALDVLKITPRIQVQGDNIRMIGKSGMAVMVDDRIMQLSDEELINFLKTIKKEDIKSIEVITNPPAKYSAEGNSGLINIIMKKTINDSWNASIGGRHHQATYSKETVDGSFNLKKNRFSLYSNLYYTKGSNAYLVNTKAFYPNLLWNEVDRGRYFSNILSTKLGLDYKISNKITTGFLFNSSNNFPVTDNENIIASFIPNTTQISDSASHTQATTKGERYNYIFNYHLVYKIDTLNRKLSLDVDYFNTNNQSDRTFASNVILNNGETSMGSSVSVNNLGEQSVRNYSVNLDMEHPFNWMVFNYGGRLSFTQTINTLEFFNLDTGTPIFDATQSNVFVFDENTQAFYFSAQKELSKKWEAKTGLRLENTKTKGVSLTINEINRINYTKLFPTAYLTYTPNDSNSFSINYGKRINRPSFRNLNPFKWINSPFSYSEGNPFLQPSFSHNLELEYLYKDFWVNTIYFSKLIDGFEEVAIIDSTNLIQQFIPKNFINNNTIGLSEDITFNSFKWLKTNFALDIYYSSTTSTIPTTLNFLKGWNGVFSASNDFTLNKNKTAFLNLNYYYVTIGVDNLDKNSAYYQFDATLKLLLLKKKLRIVISVNDIFKSFNPEYTTSSNNIKTFFTRNDDSRFFRFSITYIFGNSNIRTSKRRIKNKEELNRSH